MKRTLTKSSTNRVVSGVLGGIGEYFEVDPVILRMIVGFLTFVGVGSTIPLYILAAIIMPEESRARKKEKQPQQDWRDVFKHGEQTNKQTTRKPVEDAEEEDWSDF